ncbi:MAG: hypothetical protein QGI24_02890 [Kiritimatiellia bacterium]|jgi:hypothetical protein|nr:hypothetical protein [Kiritimatiellia bacterium]MDP6847709.1 hypothetical protein [Kiritimatiellia bacterium]
MNLKLTAVLLLASATCLNAFCDDDGKDAEPVEKQKILKFDGYEVVVPASYRDVEMHQPVAMKKPTDKGVNVPQPTEDYRSGSSAGTTKTSQYSPAVVTRSGDDEDSDSGMWLLPGNGKRSGWGWLADGASAARKSTTGRDDTDQASTVGTLFERDRLMIQGPDLTGGIGGGFDAGGDFQSPGRSTTYRTTILPENTSKREKWLPDRAKR